VVFLLRFQAIDELEHNRFVCKHFRQVKRVKKHKFSIKYFHDSLHFIQGNSGSSPSDLANDRENWCTEKTQKLYFDKNHRSRKNYKKLILIKIKP
jgi:hypothetical protein